MIKLQNISFDHCLKCTVCNVYCPVARVSFFPGPKQSGPDAERLRIKNPELTDSSLKYCSNCKRCEIACPSDVKIADIIQNAKFNYLRKSGFRFRDFILSRTDYLGRTATLINKIFNFFTRLRIIKLLLDIILKIPYQRAMPKYENGTFFNLFKKKYLSQKDIEEQVIYFTGCFVNYNNHKLGQDLIKVLNSMNIGINITKEKCCGVPLIANGYLKKAKKNANYNIQNLNNSKKQYDTKIITTSPSCTYALKYEYTNLLKLDNSLIVNDLEYVTKYLYDQFDNGNLPDFKPLYIRAAYHSPCHLDRMGGIIYTIDILKRIPGLDLVILHSECCGISGTYGYKKEFYNISQNIGKQLFDLLDDVSPEIVITDCETCALQIQMNTPYKVLHPVNIIAQSIS
jgi:glycerol-3-phosphate dehydrogenase subunit C